MSVGGGSDRGGHPYISFLFRMNFFISCKILPHLRTIEDMNFLFTTKLIEVFVHMLFKSGLF